jgi:hypothetical protein
MRLRDVDTAAPCAPRNGRRLVGYESGPIPRPGGEGRDCFCRSGFQMAVMPIYSCAWFQKKKKLMRAKCSSSTPCLARSNSDSGRDIHLHAPGCKKKNFLLQNHTFIHSIVNLQCRAHENYYYRRACSMNQTRTLARIWLDSSIYRW